MEQSYRKRGKATEIFLWQIQDPTGGIHAGISGTEKGNQRKNIFWVDGYNIIFAWEELNDLAKVNIDAARDKLADLLSNYQGFV